MRAAIKSLVAFSGVVQDDKDDSDLLRGRRWATRLTPRACTSSRPKLPRRKSGPGYQFDDDVRLDPTTACKRSAKERGRGRSCLPSTSTSKTRRSEAATRSRSTSRRRSPPRTVDATLGRNDLWMVVLL